MSHLDRMVIQSNNDDHTPDYPNLKQCKLHHRVSHDCLAPTRREVHPKIRYPLVEGVPGN